MEKRGDIVPGLTPPEAVACKQRVEEMKQRLFPFVSKMAADTAVEAQIDDLDNDFRKAAAAKTAATIQ